MQVPEKLSLIGGSILLASTLIFTLKSQASAIIPHISHSISNVYDHIGDAQYDSEFGNRYQQAQRKGWLTGHWGTAPYYIDERENMYVGSGKLQGNFYNSLGANIAHNVKTINIVQQVQAPQDSSYLFSGVKDRYDDSNYSIGQINGLDKVDTSHVTDMTSIFANDYNLKSLDLSSWDTSKLETVYTAFNNDSALQNLNVSNWDTSQVHSIDWTFFNDSSLRNLDLKDWHINTSGMDHTFAGMSNLQSLDIQNFNQFSATMPYSFGGDWTSSDNKLNHLVMGNTRLNRTQGLPISEWKDGSKTSWTPVLNDSGLHPGDWTRG